MNQFKKKSLKLHNQEEFHSFVTEKKEKNNNLF